MEHLVIFGYVIVLIFGFASLTIALFLNSKFHTRVLYHFIVKFSVFTTLIFFYLFVLTYLNVNYGNEDFYLIIPLLGLIVLSYSILIYTILHFSHFNVRTKKASHRYLVEITVSLIAFAGMISSFEIDWKQNLINQKINFGLVLSIGILIGAIVYTVFLKHKTKQIIEDERKELYKLTSIMNIIFIPGFVLDYVCIKKLNISIVIPLYYLCYAMLFLRYFIKKFKSDLFTSNTFNKDEFDAFLMSKKITEREKEIITLIMKGCSNKKISEDLFISLSTVKTHISNIFQKLDVNSRFEIISKIKGKE